MGKGSEVKVTFEWIRVVRKGRTIAEPTVHNNCAAVVDSKNVYIKNGAFRVKRKEIETVDRETKNGFLFLKTTDGKEFTFGPPDDQATFEKFEHRVRRLKGRWSAGDGGELATSLDPPKMGPQRRTGSRAPRKPRGTFGKGGGKARFKGETFSPVWDTPAPETESESDDFDLGKVSAEPATSDGGNNEAEDAAQGLRQRRRKALERKGRRVIMDSDDDDMDSSGMTTPSAEQRVVSPSVTTGRPRSPKSEKKQPAISTFFQPRSFDPSKTDSHLTPMPGDSKAAPKTPPRSLSPAAARLVQSAKRKKLQQANEWLAKSPARVSSQERRKKQILGKHPLQVLESPQPKSTEFRRLKRSRFLPPSPLRLRADAPPPEIAVSPPPPSTQFRGLRNLGNTCYVNASLQMLCTARDFLCEIKGTGGPLTRSVVSVADQLSNTEETTSVDPSAVKRAMDAKTDKFIGYEQRDAHEFLSDLVDNVHEELEEEQKSKSDGNKDAKDHVLPTDDFRLTVQVCLTCNSCGYTRTKDEIYRHLSIDIVDEAPTGGQGKDRPKASVETSLAHFFQPEEREIKCEKCNVGSHAQQTMRISSRPKYLLLHLKRFIFVEKPRSPEGSSMDENCPPSANAPPPPIEYVFRKNKAPVNIAKSLSLEQYYVEDSSDEKPKGEESAASASAQDQYSIMSIVHHHGNRASSGHYTADAVRTVPSEPFSSSGEGDAAKEATESQQWVMFDDFNTVRSSLDWFTRDKSFKQSSAYMLLYGLGEGEKVAIADSPRVDNTS